MRNTHSSEARTQESWPPVEWVQWTEDIFQGLVAQFRQAGVPQELIGDFFGLIAHTAHHYYRMHSEEIPRH